MGTPSLIKICQTLEKAYPSPKGWPNGEWPLSGKFKPRRLEVVVGAILTQNVNWKNVEKALSRMIEAHLVEADRIEGCPQAFLEDTIRSAGFYRQKAKRLKGITQFILAYPGDFYSEVHREELLSIQRWGEAVRDLREEMDAQVMKGAYQWYFKLERIDRNYYGEFQTKIIYHHR